MLSYGRQALQPDDLWVPLGYAIPFAYFVLIIGAVVKNGICFTLSILIATLTVAYAIAAFILKRRMRHSLQTGFLCNNIAFSFSVVFFALFGVMFLNMQNASALHYFIIAATYVLVSALYWASMFTAIRKDAFAHIKPCVNKAAAAGIIGGALGMTLARTFLSDLE